MFNAIEGFISATPIKAVTLYTVFDEEGVEFYREHHPGLRIVQNDDRAEVIFDSSNGTVGIQFFDVTKVRITYLPDSPI